MGTLPALLLSAGTVLASGDVGRRFGPQHPKEAVWYARLAKPGFTPPGPVFGVAWTVLETLLATSGYRLMRAAPNPSRTAALACWALTVAGVGGYPLVFFGAKRLGGSAAVVGGMAAAATGLVLTARKVDKPAAWANVPLLGWLAFAGLLSEELVRRN